MKRLMHCNTEKWIRFSLCGFISFAVSCKSEQLSLPSAIVDEDNRVEVTNALLQAAVGGLGFKYTDPQAKKEITNYVCTAFAISKNEVVTARHCLNKTASLIFAAANGATPVAVTIQNEYPNSDIAIVKTATDLASWLPVSSRAPVAGPDSAKVVSYEPGKKKLVSDATGVFKQQIHNDNQVSSGIFLHTADTVSGASGSPIFQGDKVVAVHLGTTQLKLKGKNETINYAASLVDKEKNTLPKGFVADLKPECYNQSDLHSDVSDGGWDVIWSQSLGAWENVATVAGCILSGPLAATCLTAYFDVQSAQLIQKLGDGAGYAFKNGDIESGVLNGRPVSIKGGAGNWNECLHNPFGDDVTINTFLQFYVAYRFQDAPASNGPVAAPNPDPVLRWYRASDIAEAALIPGGHSPNGQPVYVCRRGVGWNVYAGYYEPANSRCVLIDNSNQGQAWYSPNFDKAEGIQGARWVGANRYNNPLPQFAIPTGAVIGSGRTKFICRGITMSGSQLVGTLLDDNLYVPGWICLVSGINPPCGGEVIDNYEVLVR